MGKMKDYLFDKIHDAIIPFADLSEIDIDYSDADVTYKLEENTDPKVLRRPIMHVCGRCDEEYEEFLDLVAHFQENHGS